jgi:hypothetical protein
MSVLYYGTVTICYNDIWFLNLLNIKDIIKNKSIILFFNKTKNIINLKDIKKTKIDFSIPYYFDLNYETYFLNNHEDIDIKLDKIFDKKKIDKKSIYNCIYEKDIKIDKNKYMVEAFSLCQLKNEKNKFIFAYDPCLLDENQVGNLINSIFENFEVINPVFDAKEEQIFREILLEN